MGKMNNELYRKSCIEAYKCFDSASEFLKSCFIGNEGDGNIYEWNGVYFTADQLVRIWNDGEAYMLYV